MMCLLRKQKSLGALAVARAWRKISGLLISLLVIALFPVTLVGTAVAAEGTGPFPDVSGDYVNAQAIEYLKTAGVISGYPDGTFKPTDEINRAEFTKIIVGSLYSDLKGKNCFPDVKEEWFAPYVCKAKDVKIIEGYPDRTFKPEDKIKFSEASKIVANAYKVTGGTTGEQWFQPYVTALEAKKDIPLSVEFFDENVTRDEMAEMIYRLKDNVTTKASRTYKEIEGDGFVKAASCAELKERFVEMNRYNQDYMYRGYGGGDLGAVEESMPTPVAAPAPADAEKAMSATTGGGGGSTDYSTTNIQVEGVDEADIIKNDGRYIYFIKGSTIRIVDAYPADNLKELVSFSLGSETESFYPQEMYVEGNYLTVIGYSSRPYVDQPVPMDAKISAVSPSSYPYFGYNRTKVYVVDITDRSKPTVSRSVEFDGSYSSSRRVGGTLYLVMSQYMYYQYPYPVPYMTDSEGVTSTSTAEEAPDSIVPKMLDTKNGKEVLIAPCGDIYITPKPRDFNYLIAAAIPIADKTKDVVRNVIVGDTGIMYSSPDNLYIASTDWGGGYYRPYSDYGTTIYRFALSNGGIAFKNAGKVPGTILNQFAMDEYSGHLRVATTKNEYVPGSAMTSNVYILNTAMEVAGKIEGIAPGEKMYSARFMGKTGYLVTFKRVDPFFVLDLSDPKDPVVKGELKIPGYSTYMQPYDENHVLGFGNDVDPKYADSEDDFLPYDALKGMKISLFDVTNLSKPVEKFKELIGDRGTYSEILYNHKALLFDKEKGLLAFPVTVYGMPQQEFCSEYKYSTCPSTCQKMCVPSSCTNENGIRVCTADCDGAESCKSVDFSYGKPVFDGAYVYNLNLTDGFKLKGKVTHYNATDMTDLEKNGYTNYNKTVMRVIYIGEYLYTVSQGVVKANLLSDLTEKNMIELAGDIWNIYYGAG